MSTFGANTFDAGLLLQKAIPLALKKAKPGTAEFRQALRDALLPQLTDRLDDEDAWGQKLSGGEQQRLAVARALLKKPRWLFADEATSALDAAAELEIYGKLRALVRHSGGALMSIAHRPSVAAFHERQWTVEASGRLAG